MALSATKAVIDGYRKQNYDSMGLRTVKINALPKLKLKDFVRVSISKSECRIVRILDFIDDNRIHVKCYLQPKDLPDDVELIDSMGEKINFGNREIIENDTITNDLPLNEVLDKCLVNFIPENKTEDTMHANHRKDSKDIYVCRYKLIKEIVYKLKPVGWRLADDVNNHFLTDDEESSTDYESSASKLSDIDDRIGQINLNSNQKKQLAERQLVSPIKIVNNSVQKVSRYKSKGENGTISMEQLSPTKRAKIVDEMNSNYLLESPMDAPQRKSYHQRNSIKKNLNSSFVNIHNNTFDEEEQNYNISERVDSDKCMKLIIKKTKPHGPLMELNDNTNGLPANQIPDKILNKTILTLQETATPTTRRKSILKIPGSQTAGTPKRSIRIIDSQTSPPSQSNVSSCRRSTRVSSMNASAIIKLNSIETPPTPDHILKTPKTTRSTRTSVSKNSIINTPTKGTMTPQQKRQLFRSGDLTPSIQTRETLINIDRSELAAVRERLHVSAVPSSLPCRENEYQNIYAFVKDKVIDKCGGCIYISGVPGTGKTATVTSVIRALQLEAKKNSSITFDFVEINGMRLTEPRQAYVQIYRQLTGKTLAWAQARDLLEERFTESKSGKKKSRTHKTTVLLLDELDIICNRKQDVVYNLFDWTAKKDSKLVAITIANTMDLPERVLKLKVASRLGLTRITFQPYTFKQLQEVVIARLAGTKCFVTDAVQLVARKVASVSGDCRRALDICRRATEIAEKSMSDEKIVKFVHVNQALTEMFASPKVRAIKCCNKFEKLFLQAVAAEITRTGIEEVDFMGVYLQMGTLASFLRIKNPPNETQAFKISLALGASRLLIVEDSTTDIYQKIILNVSIDDLYYALKN